MIDENFNDRLIVELLLEFDVFKEKYMVSFYIVFLYKFNLVCFMCGSCNLVDCVVF